MDIRWPSFEDGIVLTDDGAVRVVTLVWPLDTRVNDVGRIVVERGGERVPFHLVVPAGFAMSDDGLSALAIATSYAANAPTIGWESMDGDQPTLRLDR